MIAGVGVQRGRLMGSLAIISGKTPTSVWTLGEGESLPIGRAAGSGGWQAVRAGMRETRRSGIGESPTARTAKGPVRRRADRLPSVPGGLDLARESALGWGDAHTRREVRVPPRPHAVKQGGSAAARGRRKPDRCGGPSTVLLCCRSAQGPVEGMFRPSAANGHAYSTSVSQFGERSPDCVSRVGRRELRAGHRPRVWTE